MIKAKNVVISFFLFWLIGGSVFADSTINWGAIKIAYQNYIKYPSEENAKKVYVLLPRDGSHSYLSEPRRTRRIIEQEAKTIEFISSHLNVLEKHFDEGKTSSVGLVFRMVSIADGEFGEDLTAMIISLICNNPKLFLEELKMNRIFLPDLKYLLYFNKQNIKCLQKVHDPNLLDIRNECINIMKVNAP